MPFPETMHIFPFITGYHPASHSASRYDQSATNWETGLDLKQLDTLVSFYFQASLAPSTTHSYESARRKHLQFCSKSNVSPIPATEGKLCSFVAFVANYGLAHQPIKCYLSAIRHLQIVGDPQISTMPKLEHVLRGIKKEHSKQANIINPACPWPPIFS